MSSKYFSYITISHGDDRTVKAVGAVAAALAFAYFVYALVIYYRDDAISTEGFTVLIMVCCVTMIAGFGCFAFSTKVIAYLKTRYSKDNLLSIIIIGVCMLLMIISIVVGSIYSSVIYAIIAVSLVGLVLYRRFYRNDLSDAEVAFSPMITTEEEIKTLEDLKLDPTSVINPPGHAEERNVFDGTEEEQ